MLPNPGSGVIVHILSTIFHGLIDLFLAAGAWVILAGEMVWRRGDRVIATPPSLAHYILWHPRQQKVQGAGLLNGAGLVEGTTPHTARVKCEK